MNIERLKQIFKYILLCGAAVFVLFIILSFVRIGFIFWFYERVFDWVSVRLGLDYYLALFISLSATAIFSASLPYLAWTFLLGRRQYTSSLIIMGITGLMCLLVYTVGADIYFDRVTGKPLKYYADTPDGRTFSHTPGYDPKYGIAYKIYSQDVRLKEVEERKKKVQVIEERKKKTQVINEQQTYKKKQKSEANSTNNALPANAVFVKTLAPGERIYLTRERMDVPPPKFFARFGNGSVEAFDAWPLSARHRFAANSNTSQSFDFYVTMATEQNFTTSATDPALNSSMIRPTKPPSERQLIQPSQKIEYLEIKLTSLQHLSDKTFRATLLFTDQSKDAKGCALAFKALNSDGMADYWKFSPMSGATLTDNLGTKYRCYNSSGLGWARTDTDWIVLQAGQSTNAIIEFSGNDQSQLGQLYDLNFEIWFGWRDSANVKKMSQFNVQLSGISLR